MLTRILASSAVAIGAAVVLAPSALAAPVPGFDPNALHDESGYFVAATDGSAFGANSTKPLLISPDGTTAGVACRGDVRTDSVYDCEQTDTLGTFHYVKVDNPLRQVWMYNVGAP